MLKVLRLKCKNLKFIYVIVIPWLRGLYRFYCPNPRARVIKPVQPEVLQFFKQFEMVTIFLVDAYV